MQTKKRLLAVSSTILFSALNAIAQQPAPPATQQTPAVTVQTQIKATDEEWKIINPRLQAVVTARQAVTTYTASTGGRGGFGGFGGPNFGTDSFDGPGNGIGGGRGGGGRGGFGGAGGPGGGPGGPGGPPNGFGGPGGPGGQGGPGGGGGRGGGGRGGAVNNAVSTALAELTTALADTTSTPEQIKAKLAAVRSARQKAATDLAAAQKALLPLLTADQEATLVSLGYLD